MIEAVIGLGFGDEGKGSVTAWRCSKANNPIVVRFSGGCQAGHTVVHNGIRHIFSSFGSGTLQGAPTIWYADCPFDPDAFLDEYNILIDKGVKPKLYIPPKCPVVTPYDIQGNRSNSEVISHGTCGSGIGATLQREKDLYSLLIEDLYHPSVAAIKLDQISKYYKWSTPYCDHQEFIKVCQEVLEKIQIIESASFLEFIIDFYHPLIYEGSQGLLLDKDIGFFPNVTRSNTGTGNLPVVNQVFYVTRAYQTRHGNGPMTNEHIAHKIKVDAFETNGLHRYQGEFRRSLLDLDLLKYAIYKDRESKKEKNGHETLVITCLDHIEDDLRLTLNGEIINCDHKSAFVKLVASQLNIDIRNVYISESSDYTRIEKSTEMY